jgi:hypothetical protein
VQDVNKTAANIADTAIATFFLKLNFFILFYFLLLIKLLSFKSATAYMRNLYMFLKRVNFFDIFFI